MRTKLVARWPSVSTLQRLLLQAECNYNGLQTAMLLNCEQSDIEATLDSVRALNRVPDGHGRYAPLITCLKDTLQIMNSPTKGNR